MEKEYIFQSSDPIKYSVKGKFEETASVIFSVPNMDVFDEVADFEQLFMGSIISAGNFANKGNDKTPEAESGNTMDQLKDNTPKASEIKVLIHLSQEVKVKDLFNSFKKIAYKTGKLDESQFIKPKHFDGLSRDDSIRMLCEYASFFTFPSLLGGEQNVKDGSETSAT